MTDTDTAGTEHTVTYTYNADGSVASVLYPDGAREDYTYTIGHLLATLTNTLSDGTVLETYTYTYDPARNLLEKQDAKGTTVYTYDPLGRLQSVTEPSGKITVYTYDPSGNRATQTVTETGENESAPTVFRTTYTYDPRNRLVRIEKHDLSDAAQAPVLMEVTEYTYDNNGNQLTTTRTLYTDGIAGTPVLVQNNTYDVWNQLVRTETENGTVVENAYNGDGRRVIKTVNGASTYYLYEYDKVILETNVFGDTTGRNVYGLNLLIRTVGVDTFYYMYNGHADVTALLTPSGQVAATYYYDAFGNVLETTGNVDNSILFAGYQYDKETGLYYLNARMYDPITARFMQEDTYLGQQNDPLSLNLYTYCHNSPLMYWDPTGHSAEYRQGGFQFGMNSTADNMAQREARRAMNRTHTGRHINNVAEAAQVSAGHGGDTFKAPTMAYHSPAIVEPLNTGYSHTLDDYAYQQTVSSQLHARQVAESTLISNPFAAEDDFYNYIRNDHYYEVAREDTIYNLIACNKSELTLYGIENATLQNQVSDYEALYYETQGFYAKQQRLYSCVSQSIVGIGQSIKGAGDALGDSWYADFSSGKATLDWVSGKISTSEYSNILDKNATTKRSIAIGFVSGAVENALNINSPAGGLGIIGQLWYIETGDTSISDVTSNLFQRKDDFLIDTFNLNEEQFNNGKAGANTYVMVCGLAISLGSSINARSSGYVSVADTPIADPYRMSYSGNAQVQMQGSTSTVGSLSTAPKPAYTLSDKEFLQKIATKAESTGARLGKGSAGTGASQGTWKHTYAQKVLERYQRMTGQKTHLLAEQSYWNGKEASRGFLGSARPDVYDPLTGTIYDYKFVKNPGKGLPSAQMEKNIANVPGVINQVEVNP